jgi:hypothetical protein
MGGFVVMIVIGLIIMAIGKSMEDAERKRNDATVKERQAALRRQTQAERDRLMRSIGR